MNPFVASLVIALLLAIVVCAYWPGVVDFAGRLIGVWQAAKPKVWMTWREIREWESPEAPAATEFIDWSSIDWDAVNATRERRAA